MLNDQIHHVHRILRTLPEEYKQILTTTAVIGRPSEHKAPRGRKKKTGPLMVKLAIVINTTTTEGILEIAHTIQAFIGEENATITSGPYEYSVHLSDHKGVPYQGRAFLRPMVSILNHPLQLEGLDVVAEHVQHHIDNVKISSVHVRIDFANGMTSQRAHQTRH
jgi:hypothetical protein